MTKPTQAEFKVFEQAPSQEEVGYVSLSATKGQMCANCRWFLEWGGCYIIKQDPKPILQTGWCDRWEAEPEPAADPVEELAEALVEGLGQQSDLIASTLVNSMPSYEMSLSKAKRPSFLDRLKNMLKPKIKSEASFSVFKDSQGEYHWHAIYSNNFKDREDEIITEAAHDKFIGRLDMGLIPFPTLQAWHTPGSDHGEAKCIWRDGHMIHAVGDFYDTPLAKSAIKYYEVNAPYLKMSHMFEAPEWAFDGTHYEDINTIEITTLPDGAEANSYTSFQEFVTMASKERSPQKTSYLEAVFGKEGLAEIDSKSAEVNKNLEAARIAFKDHADVTDAGARPATSPLTTEAEKGLKEIYTELQTQVNEMAEALAQVPKVLAAKDKLIAAQATALKDFETRYDNETAEWQKAWDILAKQVNIPPSRSSQNPSNQVSKLDGLKAQELDPQLNGDNSQESWLGGKVKPMAGVQ